ncbi:MAG: SDR family oxidoreductase [Woeseia sp.]
MNLIIFGATGATGQNLVQMALAQGHRVTAFVREPGRLLQTASQLNCVVGDVMHAATIEPALAGQDAVLCALGTMPETPADKVRRQPDVPVCSVGTINILAAMSQHKVRRIVVESSISVGESRQTGRFGAATFVRTVLKRVMEDKEKQEAALRESAADWTIVRPARLTNGPATGRVQAGEKLRWGMLSSISRADTAEFMLSAIGDPGTVGKALTIRA